MRVRLAEPQDWPSIWPIVRAVLRAGDTYTIQPDLTEAQARDFWCGPPSSAVTICENEGRVLGTAHMGPNRAGPGDHVANASYMVAAEARGRGIGRALVVDSLQRLSAQGFAALVFNAVAASNPGAVALYLDLGFEIVGRVPAGFDHPSEGRVDLLVMHRKLS